MNEENKKYLIKHLTDCVVFDDEINQYALSTYLGSDYMEAAEIEREVKKQVEEHLRLNTVKLSNYMDAKAIIKKLQVELKEGSIG